MGKWRPLRERIGRRAVDSFNRPYLAIMIRQQLEPQRFGLLEFRVVSFESRVKFSQLATRDSQLLKLTLSSHRSAFAVVRPAELSRMAF